MNNLLFEKFPDLVAFGDGLSIPKIKILETTSRTQDTSVSFQIYLTKTMYIKDVRLSRIEKSVEPVGVQYLVDSNRSHLIEYDRCIVRPDHALGPIIQRGRLYFHAAYPTKDYSQMIEKDPEFIKWATKVLGVFKKNLNYFPKRHFAYYGDGALEDEKNGWLLKDFVVKTPND